MGRRAKPWLRKGRGWFVTIAGKQVPLGNDKNVAYKLFHELMAAEMPIPQTASPVVANVLNEFLEWLKRNRAEATYESVRRRLQSFLVGTQDAFVAGEQRHRPPNTLEDSFMLRLLMAFTTYDGHSAKIAERIASTLGLAED